MTSTKRIRNTFLAGVAVVVPLVVSVWVLLTLIDTIAGLLDPVRTVLRQIGFTSRSTVVALQAVSFAGVLGLVFVVGSVTQRQFGQRAVAVVDAYMERIPGLGTVYQTARRMSDLLISTDENSPGQFREVKLVEFPGTDTYTLGFLTTATPPDGVVSTARLIEENPDGEYRTLFLPMAPNPVMGGHLTHVPAERVHDVDIEIEQALQYILTTGVVDGGGES